MTERLRSVQDRLERLLASGWRNAGEASELAVPAAELAGLGLPRLADRLRAVADADTVAEALPAIALALTACRLLRSRLAGTAPPAGDWSGPESSGRPKGAPSALLVPVGRLALGTNEAWACLRFQGLMPGGWLLLEPPPLGAGPSPWLRATLSGELRWRGRYPLGASGAVERVAFEGPTRTDETTELGERLAAARRALAAGKLRDGQSVLPAGAFKVKELQAGEVAGYVWPDPAGAAAFRALAGGRWSALTWQENGLIAPLALVTPGGPLRKARLTHLVPGTPSDPLER